MQSKHAATVEENYCNYRSLSEQNAVHSGPYTVNRAGHPTANYVVTYSTVIVAN
jgi:hypothetical protein